MTTKLQVELTSEREITMTRTFDAPKHLVLKAMTTPELIKRWLGGKRAVVTDAQQDFRVGGSYRHTFRTHEGYEFGFTGTYVEIGPDRIVHTERMDGQPLDARITLTLTEIGPATTRMQMVMELPSREVRDAVLKTGMTDGAGESYEELATLLANL